MNALKFSAKIEKGTIRLPKEYEEYDNAYVRVIVLVEEYQHILTKKEKLRLALQKMEKVNMFNQVNPKFESD